MSDEWIFRVYPWALFYICGTLITLNLLARWLVGVDGTDTSTLEIVLVVSMMWIDLRNRLS